MSVFFGFFDFFPLAENLLVGGLATLNLPSHVHGASHPDPNQRKVSF